MSLKSPDEQAWAKFLQEAAAAKNQNNFSKALAPSKRAYDIALKVFDPDDKRKLTSINLLGDVYAELGRYEDAELLYKSSVEHNRSLYGESHPDSLSAVNRLASLYHVQGRYGEGVPLRKHVLERRRQTLGDNHPATLSALNGLAATYHRAGQFDEAVPLSEEALTLQQQVLGERHPNTLTSMVNLGLAYDDQGQFDKAEKLHKRAVQIYQEEGRERDPSALYALQGLGRHYAFRGRYREAESLTKQAIDLRSDVLGATHRDTVRSMYSLGSLYRKQGEYAKADDIYQQTLPISQQSHGDLHPHTLRAELGNIFNLSLSDRVTEAVETLKRHATYRLAYAEAQLATTSGAEARSQVLERQSIFQDSVLTLGLDHPRPDTIDLAGDVMLSWKQVQGAEATYTARLSRTEDDPDIRALADEISALRTQLAALAHVGTSDQNPIAILDELEAKELALARLSGTFRQRRQARRASLRDLQDTLSAETAVIEFRQYRPVDMKSADRGDPRFIALLVQPDQPPKLADVGSVKRVTTLLRDIHNNQQSARAEGAAAALYDQLFSAFAKDIKAFDTIYLAPDGILHLLPFDRLRLSDGSYLGERQSLRFVPTGRDLMIERNLDTQTAGLLALGGVEFGAGIEASSLTRTPASTETLATLTHDPMETTRRQVHRIFENFDPLPASKSEVEQIALLYQKQRPADPITVWTGSSASESSLKNLDGLKETPRVVHIATHGFYLPRSLQTLARPQLYSGLVLAGANQSLSVGKDGSNIASEDGILYSLEAQDLDLEGTELVVLSACDTGKGVIDYSDGVVGMVQALRIAGAQQVLMTLWPVHDKPTAAFMESFHSHWLADPDQDAASALDATKEKFRQHDNPAYQDPEIWAPFVIVGA